MKPVLHNEPEDIDFVEVKEKKTLLIKFSELKSYHKWAILIYLIAFYFDILLCIHFCSPSLGWSGEPLRSDPLVVDLLQCSAVTLVLAILAKVISFLIKDSYND